MLVLKFTLRFTRSSFIWPCKSLSDGLFLTKTFIVVVLDLEDNYRRNLFWNIMKIRLFKAHWGSLAQFFFNRKIVCPKLVGFGRSLDFNSPKTWCWSSLGSILAVQTIIPNKLLVFGWGYTFLGKDWCTGYQALLSSLLTAKNPKLVQLQPKTTVSAW